MSKRETPMIFNYWRRVGGTLVTEFPAVQRSDSSGPRRLDAIIIAGGVNRQVHWREVSLADKDVIVIQAKAHRLGMYLMGQALFSAELVRPFNPRSVRSVALCSKDDSTLRALLDPYPHVEVVVLSRHEVLQGVGDEHSDPATSLPSGGVTGGR